MNHQIIKFQNPKSTFGFNKFSTVERVGFLFHSENYKSKLKKGRCGLAIHPNRNFLITTHSILQVLSNMFFNYMNGKQSSITRSCYQKVIWEKDKKQNCEKIRGLLFLPNLMQTVLLTLHLTSFHFYFWV